MRSLAKRLRGFTIVSAIFILVVLSVLGAFIVSVSTSQQIGSALDVQGVRAYQAARAGIEWGLYQVQSSNGFNYADPNSRICPAATTSFAPAGATFAGFTVTVGCAAITDVSGGPTIFRLTATACNQAPCPNTTAPGTLYIERRLEVAF